MDRHVESSWLNLGVAVIAIIILAQNTVIGFDQVPLMAGDVRAA